MPPSSRLPSHQGHPTHHKHPHTKPKPKRHHYDPLKLAFDRAKKLGWLPFFQEAADKYGFTPELLLGIGYRETGLDPVYLKKGGDYRDGEYHGFGLMQMDIGSYKAWIDSGKWKNARDCILKGAEVLKGKLDNIIAYEGKPLPVGKHVKGKAISEPNLTRVAVAAYNSGLWAYYHFSKGEDPDKGTTGRNYSSAVLKFARRFQLLLAAEYPQENAPPIRFAEYPGQYFPL